MYLTPIMSIKSENDKKAEKYSMKIHFCRYFTSKNLDLYKFKVTFLDNNKPEDLLLFL